MLVSVIIPVYNGERFLRECLESVRACSSAEMECIIINDGSTDGTAEICKSFVDEDCRFRLIDKKNSGASDSRNMGIAEAVGKYIFFLDADDYIDTDYWQEIITNAKSGIFDMIAFGYYSMFEFGGVQAELFPKDININYLLLSTTLLNTCWGKLLRTDIIKENNLAFCSELRIGEDAAFIIDFVRKAKEFKFSNSCILYYRIHDGSIMQQTSEEDKLTDFARLVFLRREYLNEHYHEDLKRAMYRELFSMITDLYRACAKNTRQSEIRRIYKKCMKNETVRAIMLETNKKQLSPVYKKIEYILMQGEYYSILAMYYKMKSCLTALKVRRPL